MTDRSHMTSRAGDMVKKSTTTKWGGGLLWALCTDPGVGIPVPADRGWGSPVGRPILVGAFNPEGRGKLIWKIKTNNENFTLRYMKNLILLIIHESVKNKMHPLLNPTLCKYLQIIWNSLVSCVEKENSINTHWLTCLKIKICSSCRSAYVTVCT